MRLKSIVFGMVVVSIAVLNMACDEIECGPGTVLEEGRCVPLQPANCTGDGVRFENGRCVPDGTVMFDAGMNDMGVQADTGGGSMLDYTPECASYRIADSAQACGTDTDCLAPGELVCFWGRAVDFITGEPLPIDNDPLLEIQIKDLLVAAVAVTPLDGLLGETILMDDEGYFEISQFDVTGATSAETIVIAGESSESETENEGFGEVWQRTITGLFQLNPTGTVFGEDFYYSVTRAQVAEWTQVAVDFGFFLGQVIESRSDGSRTPVSGAVLSDVAGGDLNVLYFADDGTSIDEGATETGVSGRFIISGTGLTSACNVTAPGLISTGSFRCGAAAGRITIQQTPMLAE